MLTTTLLLLAPALAPAMAPQDPPPTGSLAHRALVITADDASVSDGKELQKLPVGPAPVTPQRFGQQVSRFSFATMIPGSWTNLRMGAVSSGTSIIVASWDGRADLSESISDWAFLTYSVVPGTTGKVNSAYRLETLATVGGDVFSVYLPGSEVVIPPEEVGIVQKARDSNDIGVTDIKGIDQTLNALTLAPHIAEEAEAKTQTFYFTIAPGASLLEAPQSWFGSTTKSSATVLQITHSNGAWSAPTIFQTYATLGLEYDDVITALAVDTTTKKILLATATAAHQLWVALFDLGWWSSPTYAGTYKDRNGGSFAENVMDLNPGDVIDALCSNDPGKDEHQILVSPTLAQTHGQLGKVVGRDRSMHIAASRVLSGDGQTDQIKILLIGGPTMAKNQGFGIAALYQGTNLIGTYKHSNHPKRPTAHLFSVPKTGPIPRDGAYKFRWILSWGRGSYTTHSATVVR